MENVSNKISPFFTRLFNNQLLDRILGIEDSVNQPNDPYYRTNSHDISRNNNNDCETQKNPTSGVPDFQYHTQSRYLQGRHLGRLNPSLYLSQETEDLYEVPPGHIGRVWFSISYNKVMELLKVTIHKARNLRQISTTSSLQFTGSPTDQSGTSADETSQWITE
ncbi:unnamed protein product [Heterobilharzia americana]|nr:unnamed protein product [Heterobilharzia americana]